MNQRFTLDRKSFEEFLAAVSLVQQVSKQTAHRRCLSGVNGVGQPLVGLLQLQQTINSGTVNMDAAMSAVAELTRPVVGASSAGVWLFRTRDRFSCAAHAGAIYDPERLGLDLLAHLASCDEAEHSLRASRTLTKSSYYPGYPNSVAVAALRLSGKLVGVLAAFSMAFDAFGSRDLDNLHFLARLLEQALQQGVQSGYREAVALEHSVLLQVLERVMPSLNELDSHLRAQPAAHVSAAGPALAPEECAEGAGQPEPPQSLFSPSPTSETERTPVAADLAPEDVSLPGVGVRAALGDVREYGSDSQPFFLWVALHHGAIRAGGLATECGLRISRFASGALIRTRTAATRVAGLPYRLALATYTPLKRRGGVLRNRIAGFRNRTITVRLVGLPRWRRPTFPHIEFARIRNLAGRSLKSLRSALLAGETIRDKARDGFHYVLRMPRVRMQGLLRRLRHAHAHIVPPAAEHLPRMRTALRRQKKVVIFNAHVTGRALYRAGNSLAVVSKYTANSTLAALGTGKTLLSRSIQSGFNKRSLRKSGGAIAVLAIMAVFLALQARVRNSIHSEAVSAATPARRVPVSISSHLAFATPMTAHPAETARTSHLEITDLSVADRLHNSTRYEVATLRRAADYGDDEAAFQLGMAYETGYYLRQNCSQAARWVKMAAEAGNPAAEYNLGLRYYKGDGLAADQAAAEHWLQMASAHRYSPTQLPATEEP